MTDKEIVVGRRKGKTVKLLLEDGTLNGVMTIVDSSWYAGEMYVAPKESVEELLSTGACNKFGVYLLLSDDMVYVGQSSDLAKRVMQHIAGKEWWERVVIFTTSDNSLNRADIDYLEYYLIKEAKNSGRLDSDNKSKGNIPKVDKFRKPELDQYLEEALFLIELIGISVFVQKREKVKNRENDYTPTVAMKDNGQDKVGERSGKTIIQKKREALEYIRGKGFHLGENLNYASRQEARPEFWINPKKDVVKSQWELILNNQYRREIVYISVPKDTFIISDTNGTGFKLRLDKPLIDLNINEDTLKDRRSGYDFTDYVVFREKY